MLEELNVREIGAVTHVGEPDLDWFNYEVKPRMNLLGRKHGPATRAVAAALASQDPAQAARAVMAGGSLEAGGVEVLPEEVEVVATDLSGWVSAAEGGYAVRVSTVLTAELEQEGLARELVHRIQNMRRSAGFDIADRIVTSYQAPDAVRSVMTSGRLAAYIRGETLSTGLVDAPPPEDAYTETQRVDGMELLLGVRRA